MSSSGEFLNDFLDESPGVMEREAQIVDNDKGNTVSGCDDGMNCEPIDSFFMHQHNDVNDDNIIPRIQQQNEGNDGEPTQFHLSHDIDPFLGEGQKRKPISSHPAAQMKPDHPYVQKKQKWQLSQQPILGASPPFIVHLPIHTNHHADQHADKLTSRHPPPPPPPLPPPSLGKQHVQPQTTNHNAQSTPPPPLPNVSNSAKINIDKTDSEPSTPIVEQVSHNPQPNTHHHSHHSENKFNPTCADTPPYSNPYQRTLSHTSTVTLTPRSVTAPRLCIGVTTPRPTPGVIRSRIRTPSISPPDSDAESVGGGSCNGSADGKMSRGDDSHVQPPFSDVVLRRSTDHNYEAECMELYPTKSNPGASIPPPPLTMEDDLNNTSGSETSQNRVHAAPAAETIQRDHLGEPKNQLVEEHKGLSEDSSDTDQQENSGRNVIEESVEKEDDDSSSASYHSHISKESELTDDDDNIHRRENDKEDFVLPSPRALMVSFSGDCSWDPKYNRYGIVHVKLLRAQRLPCTSGASVNASLSLPPWKGRIRVSSRMAAEGPLGAGVCVRWDRPLNSTLNGDSNHVDATSKDGGSPPPSPGFLEEPVSHSMVHAYNNEDTPIPRISLELSTPTFGGVIEKYVCSTSLPCYGLLRNPGMWFRQWLPATLAHETPLSTKSSVTSNMGSRDQPGKGNLYTSLAEDEEEIENENRPWILIEACFEPKTDESEPVISEDTDTIGSIPRDFVAKNRSPDGRFRDLRITPEKIYTSIDDESISKTSTLTTAFTSRNSVVSKSHLLRVRSFWSPAWCSVCSKILVTGWMQGNFECEACHIFCCRDCQLQVDVRIPCGSEVAKMAVKNAQKYQISFNQLMTTLAPHDDNGYTNGASVHDGAESKPKHRNALSELETQQSSESKVTSINGIGLLRIRVLKACLFEKNLPPEAEPGEIFDPDFSNLRTGDHYCRISWSGSKDSRRTKTVLQASKPVFESEEMIFDVSHYGAEYKLEVVDVNTDKPVGACLLSAQGLLQWQRDEKIRQGLISLLDMSQKSDPRRVKLELRTGVKDAFGLNFYNASKLSGESKEKNSSGRAGEISGWLEIDVVLDEDRSLFLSSNPRQCPPRANEEFDIALIQLHIARISNIIEDIQKIFSTYLHLVSWKNRTLTGISLVIFVTVTMTFDLEYIGSLPIGILVLYMVYLGHLRFSGHFKDRWIMKQKEALVESETKIEKNHSIVRPIGLISITELRGRNIRSRDLGLPGSFGCCISYDPVRYASDKMKTSLAKLDESCSYTHDIASTVSPGITSNPVWSQVRDSSELVRLKHLLPNDRLWGQSDQKNGNVVNIRYPILQPIAKGIDFNNHASTDITNISGVQLLPWESSFGAVVFQVRFSDVLGSFQMFDNVIGEVALPLSKLARGPGVEGWFRLLPVGTKDTVPGQSSVDDVMSMGNPPPVAEAEKVDTNEGALHRADFPELFVKFKFSARAITKEMASSSDNETCKVICEEIVRNASTSKESNISMIGSSISTLNRVRSLGGNLQNQISYVVDTIERVRNAFNFSNPQVTTFILICLIILWRILASIPTRVVILLAGVGQFGATFYNEFIPRSTPKILREASDDDDTQPPRGNIFENLFLSLPTDEDLRRTYFWESCRLGEREREKFVRFLTISFRCHVRNVTNHVPTTQLQPISIFRQYPRENLASTSFGRPDGMTLLKLKKGRHLQNLRLKEAGAGSLSSLSSKDIVSFGGGPKSILTQVNLRLDRFSLLGIPAWLAYLRWTFVNLRRKKFLSLLVFLVGG